MTHSADTPVEPNEFEMFNSKIDINELPIFSRSQLMIYNGVDNEKLYVAIRGYIYDVTPNLKSYGPGKAYHKLVGKDVSRLLGLNRLQLKEEPDNSDLQNSSWYTQDLNTKQNEIIDKWVLFFRKRYNIVGIIVDHER